MNRRGASSRSGSSELTFSQRDEGPDDLSQAAVSNGLTSTEASFLLSRFGYNVLEEKTVPKWQVFLSQLYQPMPIMIWLAAAVEGCIGNYYDMVILLSIQFLNASLSYYEVTKAGDAVAALKASLRPVAFAKRDGRFQTVEASHLVPGDLVTLASGAAVPADCFINSGEIEVDESALTGESLPVTKTTRQRVLMGSTVVRGEVEATVEFTGKESFFGKTASLLAKEEEPSNLHKVLVKIMVILVAVSLALCLLCFHYLLKHGQELKSALSFTVVLLIASIPIAIEIVCTTTLALGSKELSSHGAIVSRLAAIEDLAGMNMLCSDKTGTLTMNRMVIQEETPVFVQGLTQSELLRYAALACRWHEPPKDALDRLVLEAADLGALHAEHMSPLAFMPFDPVVKRTESTVRAPSGEIFKVSKGAPYIILQLVSVDQPEIVGQVSDVVSELGHRGIRALAIARTVGDICAGDFKWQLLGLLTFLDPPRLDTRETLMRARHFGVPVKMITGDHVLIAKEMARQLGIGDNILDPAGLPRLEANGKVPTNIRDYGPVIEGADGFAQVFPEHKYLIVECLRRNGYKVGMTGDGVNDAPALKRADVGVAVQGSTDAARAAADIVLTQPGLSTIVEGIVVARVIFQRIQNFLTYRVAATLQLLVFFFWAVLTLHPRDFVPYPLPADFPDSPGDWPDFFRMPVIMLMLITLLNDGTLISVGYDRVRPSAEPDRWDLRSLFLQSSMLGLVACASSLLLLHAALDSWNPHGWWAAMGLPGLSYGQVTTMVYLKVSISDFLTLFSARTSDTFFWSIPPSPVLLGAGSLALILSTLFATFWPSGVSDGVLVMGLGKRHEGMLVFYVWAYCLLCWFIQDAAKVGCARGQVAVERWLSTRKRKSMIGSYALPEAISICIHQPGSPATRRRRRSLLNYRGWEARKGYAEEDEEYAAAAACV